MVELFHKPAKKDWQRQLRRAGVLNAESLSESSDLRAYAPSPELALRISHYWILTWCLPEDTIWRPTEVLSGPVVNLFFMRSGSFIQGIAPTTLEYEAHDRDVIAGITFLPGGFYPYWNKPMHSLPKGKIALKTVFPSLTESYCQDLLALDAPEHIAALINDFFLKQPTRDSPHQGTILEIVRRIERDPDLRTVGAISSEFRIPERTLQYIFRTEVGTSLKWLILRARLLEAMADTFGESDPDWGDIAYKCGYSSQAHFVTDFKKVFGSPPTLMKAYARA